MLPAPNNSSADMSQIGNEPHFAPLLHATLKMMAGKVLLISVALNWLAYVEAVEDSKTKKRSCLVLNLFPQGPALAPGLPAVLEAEEAQSLGEDLPSYASAGSANSIWSSSEAVQGEIGRILRIARRLPDKCDMFYKELNKFRFHALSSCNLVALGFMVDVLERECQHASDVAAAAELSNVVSQIRPEGRLNVRADLIACDKKRYPLIVDT